MLNINILYQIYKFSDISDYHNSGITGKNVDLLIHSTLDKGSITILSDTIHLLAPDTKIHTILNGNYNFNNLIIHVGYEKDVGHISDKLTVFTLDKNIKFSHFITSPFDNHLDWLHEIGHRIGLYILIYGKLKLQGSLLPICQLSILAHLNYIDSIKNLHTAHPDISEILK